MWGIRLGALSDYPADAKLQALGIRDQFEVVLSAQSPEVGVFKPHPGGLEAVLDRMRVSVNQALYVGDREEVDAAAAEAAGLACAILTTRAGGTETCTRVKDYSVLHRILFRDGAFTPSARDFRVA